MRARLVEAALPEPPANQAEELPANQAEELPHWLRAELEARSVSYAVASGGGGLLDAARSLCRARPSKPILHDVSASFPSGTLSAVMGPSGAGKSTLLNCLRSGSATSGSLLINGQSYREHGDTRRVIRVIPQDDILLPGLTPFEMLMFAARLSLPASSTAASRLARVRAVLSRLRLSDADSQTRIGSVEKRGLSGGQRKRVSIGLELLADPCAQPPSPARPRHFPPPSPHPGQRTCDKRLPPLPAARPAALRPSSAS
jgi:ABC-type multidrug transport system fused ATPase/permease subunit